MTRTAERWELIGHRTRGYTDQPGMKIVAVPVTPRAALDSETQTARSCRDALVQFCDRHAWRIVALGMATDPPTPLCGTIRTDAEGKPLAVTVVPVDVTRGYMDARPGRAGVPFYEGTYRIEIEGR